MSSFISVLLWSLSLFNFAHGAPRRVYERATLISKTSDLLREYDYVIIGGGTSGLTVADRLTEDSNTRVLVIEYGDVDAGDGGTACPGLPVPDKYRRDYVSIPQKGLEGRTSPIYTGAVVGGGTVVNAMFFNRGSKLDYDAWVKLGNPGWGWSDLLPYFKKATTFTPPPADLKREYPISSDLAPHGLTGPIGASFPVFQYDVIKKYYKGWNQAGVPSLLQPNDGFTNGAFYSTISLDFKNQSRSSASSGHYKPLVGKRKFYHLITGFDVTKIDFNPRNGKVSCIKFSPRAGGRESTITAKKEYILAAGTVQSAKLMQLSGIGPKNVLKPLGIKTLLDLPVGYNFHDQPTMFLALKYAKFNGPSPDKLGSDKQYAAQQLDLYEKKRQGAYTIPYIGGTAVTFLDLPSVTKNYKQIIAKGRQAGIASGAPPGSDQKTQRGYQAQVDILLQDYASNQLSVQETAWGGGGTIPVAILKPLSRGSILINSTNPKDSPVIDYNTFGHPIDIAVAVASLKKNRDFFNSPAIKGDLGATETNPGASVTSDADLEKAIRGFATSTWAHPVGSLPMMKKEYGGIVDPNLKVYGIKNLRVVDASIFPIIPGTHTSWPVYAVAEKAADLIKKSNGRH